MSRRRPGMEQAERAPEVHQMHQRLVDIGVDRWIETGQGRRPC
ncbi:MAG TPA: hypothetical protein VK875_06590 [Euzebyales bacterium]|nr:hypothetical protein [Euzebyales bacterium]